MYDLIIIGAGPAGLTAALYAGRFRLDAVLLEKMSLGGQIVLSSAIENFPGVPGPVETQELIARMKKQVDDLSVPIIDQEALEIIARGNQGFEVKIENKNLQARSIIIASGASPKKLGVPGEDKFIGRGVSYCGTCDGPLFRGKDVIVVGGGDRALEDAIFLTSYARSVKLVHRRDKLRAAGVLIEKAKANPKISFILDSVLEEISGQNKVQGIKVKNVKNGLVSEFSCDGVFVFVGIKPNTDRFKDIVKLNQAGFIITSENMVTSMEGIFACGDCRAKTLYQVINACGDAAVACDSAHKYLLNH
ncbi:MAG: thioredoxin-disulfide reductase [Candidatus Omnitrophica bacterium]|jgi:thioredoxin reductase (NADPH)|nr:thioredoxin-disulfide reductase [Candidatus Omnitrophota bacterium]